MRPPGATASGAEKQIRCGTLIRCQRPEPSAGPASKTGGRAGGWSAITKPVRPLISTGAGLSPDSALSPVTALPGTGRHRSPPIRAAYTVNRHGEFSGHRPNAAMTRPPPAAMLMTAVPCTRTRCQVLAPSWVAHRPGPNAQPSRALANMIWLTALPGAIVKFQNGAGGAGTVNQCRPPSVVWRSRSSAQPRAAHGGLASSQPVEAEMKLAETGLSAGRGRCAAAWCAG